ncbi:MAG: hypothetical protein IKC58_05705, partial [Clostridia bacterium]|nr:hypothetical protein [Clostridia bacterium]
EYSNSPLRTSPNFLWLFVCGKLRADMESAPTVLKGFCCVCISRAIFNNFVKNQPKISKFNCWFSNFQPIVALQLAFAGVK